MPFIATIEIRFADIDKLGHVNNAKYLTYLEHARVKYFEGVIGKTIEWSEKGIILARAEIDFLHPILLEDQIEIETTVSRLGNKSFDMTYRILKQENGSAKIMAEAKTILVCYSYTDGATIPIPVEWVDKVITFERFDQELTNSKGIH